MKVTRLIGRARDYDDDDDDDDEVGRHVAAVDVVGQGCQVVDNVVDHLAPARRISLPPSLAVGGT